MKGTRMQESFEQRGHSPLEFKSVAVVSGKGGSGKTLVATAIAEGLGICKKSILLVDADVGTAGLSYYLGFSAYSRARSGLTEMILGDNAPSERPLSFASARQEIIDEEPAFSTIKLFPRLPNRYSKEQS